MSEDLTTKRAKARARLERRLIRNGWGPSNINPDWWGTHKGEYRIEMDEIGIWYYEIPFRLAGLAWDSLDGALRSDGKIVFGNGVNVQL